MRGVQVFLITDITEKYEKGYTAQYATNQEN